ncbi:hypothetical protein EKO27_g11311 [Xylaria grammica]|uniref:Ankyrin 2,3/unc44 n=1 Tax=Xylaria grammica TaxID=363999 RepID=A0A439CNR5_9PEZI|nr:hypothetical protein EKO27_g11311 [Xylaria grammica]
MASPECDPRKTYARDLVALSDVELDRYLEAHRLEGGATGAAAVVVEDPQNLPESFIQRLRDRARKMGNAAQSLPVDLDRVNVRLLEIPADNDPLPRPLFGTGKSTTEPGTPTRTYVIYARDRYHELINRGGRPLYPVDLLDSVAEDPRAYRDMLRPWLDHHNQDPPEWDLYGKQLRRWKAFLHWQQKNRREDPPLEVEGTYEIFVRDFRRASPTYTEAVKELLAHYGPARPFQFHDDPKQQDKLMTWIEYLGFECAVHYLYVHDVKKNQTEYDKAWKTLVETKVLRPFETEEYVRTTECAIHHDREREQAYRAVKSAKTFLLSAQQAEDNPRESCCGKPAAGTHIRVAQSSLDAANESLAVIERRNGLVTNFIVEIQCWRIAQRRVERKWAQVEWILEQLPMVEAEMNECGEAETGPDSTRGTGGGRDQDNVGAVGRVSQKQRQNTHEPDSPSNGDVRSGSQGGIHKRSHDDTNDNEPPSKRLRSTRRDPASGNEPPRGAKTESAGEPQRCRASKIERPDGDKRAVRKVNGYTSSKATKSSNGAQRRNKSTQDTPQASATPLPLRRSARIAARQQASKATDPSDIAKSSPRITRKTVHPSSIWQQNLQAKVPATKITKRRARSGAERRSPQPERVPKGNRRNR